METKFTKGEWFAVDYAGRFVMQNGETYEDADILSYDDFDGQEFCVSKEEAEANAKLICAAPELLKACQMLIDCLESRGYTKDSLLFTYDEFRIAKKAIKKATE